MASKIQLYSLATPNGQKVGVALEEMGLPYEPHLIDIAKNDQFTPEFMAINPNSNIPAIVDPDGTDGKPINVFESGAILLYLAKKSGKFLSEHPRHKWETIQWLMFQISGFGPMLGQEREVLAAELPIDITGSQEVDAVPIITLFFFSHFYRFAKDRCLDPYPTERYANESMRLLGVLEKRLEGREFLVDDGYSIADMALFPGVRGARANAEKKLQYHIFPNVNAWVDRCMARPASAKGTTVCKRPE